MHARGIPIAFVFTCLATVAAVAPDPAHAFDGRRSGFVLGFGAGWSRMTIMSAPTDLLFIATDLRVGVGLGPRLVVQYSGKQLWLYRAQAVATVLFPAVGITYYLRDVTPSVVVRAGIGASTPVPPTEEFGRENHNHLSLFGGVGYEFLPHVCIEMESYRLGWLDEEDDRWGVAVLVSALAY